MNASLLAAYKNVEFLARTNAEQFSGRSTRVLGLMGDGMRGWLNVVTGTIGETAKAVEGLARCRTAAEVADVQRAFLESTTARAVSELRHGVTLATAVANELTASVVAPISAQVAGGRSGKPR